MAADKSAQNVGVCDSNKNDVNKDVNNVSEELLPQTSFDDLNDDCLLEIFEMVGTVDWIRLSKVSQRYRSILATQLLTRRPINFSDLSRNHSIRKVFRRFGPFASGVKISASDVQYQHERRSNAEELFHLLAKHCNSGKLRDLSLLADFSELRAEYVDALGKQIINLRHISVHSMRKWLRVAQQRDDEGELVNRLLSHAKKIESIELVNVPLNGEVLAENRLDALKKISFFNCTAIDFCSFYALMRRIGKQVQTFEWKNSTFTVKSTLCQTISDVCEVIGDCLQNLTALTIEMNYGQNYCQERKSRE